MAAESHGSGQVSVELRPLGRTVSIPRGASLQDLLFNHGVEFPCGGRGLCKGCKIKVLSGSLPVTNEDARKLSAAEVAAGWRLACCARPLEPLVLELEQFEAAILSDDSKFAFTPQEGLGIAVDLGTTTLVAQLLDLQTGNVLGVRAELNAQARHGADIMSRVEFAVAGSGRAALVSLIREQIGEICFGLVRDLSEARGLKRVVIVGNTVMHHLFCDIDLEPLSHVPFEPHRPGQQVFSANGLGWNLPGNPEVQFLACLGGFVGSDILAGILATNLHNSDVLVGLMDLGTNGEIVVGNRHRMLCASTAAGPAFEGARISMGMRAATGAISEVHARGDSFVCHVIGNGTPRGICGSGLVDAVAVALNLNRVTFRGRLVDGESLGLLAPVALNQWDIRELQLAKGAIAAGLRILLEQWGATMEDLREVNLAGAFGNYINYDSARRIGLLNFPAEKVQPVGNTALKGAKVALFSPSSQADTCSTILQHTTHVSLHEDPHFQEIYVEEMSFPDL
jgi:uncharacterized 2Fe-2S/4Fe-4S cluster protein (DUF4445 family)